MHSHVPMPVRLEGMSIIRASSLFRHSSFVIRHFQGVRVFVDNKTR